MIRKNLLTKRKQSGLSLIELMISIVIGLIILAASLAVYVLIFKGTVIALRSSQLNYDLDNLMLVMTHDIRRAGYWGGAVSGWDIDDQINPFMAAGVDLTINNDWDGLGNDCIVYSYDFNNNGIVDNSELVGFRRNSDASVSMRVQGTDPDSCDDAGGTWEQLTITEDSEQVSITDFNLSLGSLPPDTTIDGSGPYPAQVGFSQCDNVDDSVSAADPSVDCSGYSPAPSTGDTLAVRRVVNIRITGQAGRDSEIYKSLSSSVRVGNDALKAAP